MNTKDYTDFDDEFDPGGNRRRRTDTRRSYACMSEKMAEEARRFKHAQAEFRDNFKFTYEPAQFEEWWLLASLAEFYEHRWISDVLRRVKSGKEASVYQCRPGAAITGGLVAARHGSQCHPHRIRGR